MRQITVVIPCHNPQYLDAVIRSIDRQTCKPDRIVIVDDGAGIAPSTFSYRPDLPQVWVVDASTGYLKMGANIAPARVGKIKAVYLGLKFVETELVLMLDADTFMEKRCLEMLELHLVGDIVAVTASVRSTNAESWTGFCRTKSYDSLSLLNGCTLLIGKTMLEDFNLSADLIDEDEELTEKINMKSNLMWLRVKGAKSYTVEPTGIMQVIRQQTRWFYGTFSIEERLLHRPFWERTQNRNLLYFVAIALLWLNFSIVLIVATGADTFAVVFPSFMFTFSLFLWFVSFMLKVIHWTRRGFGIRQMKYGFIYVLSFIHANVRYLFKAKPSWD